MKKQIFIVSSMDEELMLFEKSNITGRSCFLTCGSIASLKARGYLRDVKIIIRKEKLNPDYKFSN